MVVDRYGDDANADIERAGQPMADTQYNADITFVVLGKHNILLIITNEKKIAALDEHLLNKRRHRNIFENKKCANLLK